MDNRQIATIFDEIADLLEFQGANTFRIRAYRNGSRVIRDLPEPVSSILKDEQRQLTDIDGIGKDLAAKCSTLVETQSLPLLDELRAQVPPSALMLLRIPGLGPKKAAVIHRELGVSNLAELEAACHEHRVRGLKGFGPKTEESILKGMAFASASGTRMYWSEADEIVQSLLAHMSQCARIVQMEMAGSYRRRCETVGDLDLLVESEDATAVMNHFSELPMIADVIARGDTKMSIRIDVGLQIDLRVVPHASFGAALQYFTGSKEHNVMVRGLAKQMARKVNEYGVFDLNADDDGYVAGVSEAEVYAALQLPWFPPELREARGEFEWKTSAEIPSLIEQDQIQGDLHMHTTATDGKASIPEMVSAARGRGLSYIAITDHSKRVSMANGLDASRLVDQWQEIDRINEELDAAFTLLKGIECDILEDGGMDLADDVLAKADWVLASVHYGQNQSRSQITDRIVGAIQNPFVTAIAHPTGRLINKRRAYDVDMEAVFEAAREHHTFLELNANPARLDLNDVHCAAAKRMGIPVVISTDAHRIEDLDVMRFGVMQARRAGLTAAEVLNTRTWSQIEKLLGR